MSLAPILLFTYRRLDLLQQTLTSLKKNYGALDSHLIVFSDGYKSDLELQDVLDVRAYLKGVTGFKSVVINEAKTNKGLANSIIEGVTQVLEKYSEVIVLEDDLVTSPNFLNFMNQALNFYKNNTRVFSISGFTVPLSLPQDYQFDNYFTLRGSSWGWATWDNRWLNIDWKVNDFEAFIKNRKQRVAFNKMGSDLTNMLQKQMKGRLNSWAVRWVYHQFKEQLYTVYPTVSKVRNIGFGKYATNTSERFTRFNTCLDTTNKMSFIFSRDIKLENSFIKQFIKPQLLSTRIVYKLINSLLRLNKWFPNFSATKNY